MELGRALTDFIADNFGSEVSLLYTFPVLFPFWEMDGEGYVIQTEQGRKLLVTNHGSPLITDASFLDERLEFYTEISEATQKAKELLLGEI
jgi:hypothetical protein